MCIILQVAWSIAKVSAESYDVESLIMFDRVDVNKGNAWTSSNYPSVVIPHAGWYYLHLDFANCYIGVVGLEMQVNGKGVFTAQFLAYTNKAAQTRGQSTILQLSTGDRLAVSPIPNIGSTCLYGMSYTAFYGMLLIPT